MGTARQQHAAEVLADVVGRTSDTVPDHSGLPVLPAFHGLLPELRRGQVVEVDDVGALPLALVAGATQEGSWCAMVGMADCGLAAAAELGCALGRVLLVDEPGDRWVDVTAALLEAVDVVLLRPPARPQTGVVRRLVALARKAGSVLVVTGGWEGASVRLRIDTSVWTGLGQGHGRLESRRVKVVASGRGAGGRPRSAWLWLPGPHGTVDRAELASVTDMSQRFATRTARDGGADDISSSPAPPADPAEVATPADPAPPAEVA